MLALEVNDRNTAFKKGVAFERNAIFFCRLLRYRVIKNASSFETHEFLPQVEGENNVCGPNAWQMITYGLVLGSSKQSPIAPVYSLVVLCTDLLVTHMHYMLHRVSFLTDRTSYKTCSLLLPFYYYFYIYQGNCDKGK